MSRNGTFSTGMKKRTSAPVDVLNALRRPVVMICCRAPSVSVAKDDGSKSGGTGGGTISRTSSFKANG